MNKRTKFRIVRRAVHRYLESQELQKNVKDMEQDIKSVDQTITQLESKRDSIEDFYGISYKIIHAQIQGLFLLKKHLHDRLAIKKEQYIPLSLLRKIIYEDKIKTEEAIIVVLKTYFNIEAGENVIPAGKDALSLALCHGGTTHRTADEEASIIIDKFFNNAWSNINTRKNRDPKFQRGAYGGYLRNHPRFRPKATEEENPSPHN